MVFGRRRQETVKVEMITEPEISVSGLLRPIAGRMAREVFRNYLLSGEQMSKVEVVFVGNETITRLNRRHRGMDSATDVLAFRLDGEDFPQPEPCPCHQQLTGSVVICPEQVASVPGYECSSRLWRLAFVACHGLLHLAGWEHFDDDSFFCMMQSTEEIMEHVFPARR